MNLMKRAWLYVTRKKGRSILLFLVLFVMTILLLAGLSMRGSADRAAAAVRESLGSSFQLTPVIDYDDPSLWVTIEQADGGESRGYNMPVRLSEDLAEKVMDAGGIKEYNGVTRDVIFTNLNLKPGFWAYLYEEAQTDPFYLERNPNTLTEAGLYKTNAGLISNTKSELSPFFRNGAFELVEGRHIGEEDTWMALISEDLAARNGLAVGGTFTGEIPREAVDGLYSSLPGMRVAGPYTFEVAGIYKINFGQVDATHTGETDIPENFIFISDAAMRQYLDEQMENNPYKDQYHELTFFADDPKNLDTVMADVKKLDLNWQYLAVERDDTAYRAVAGPLDAIVTLATFLVAAMTAGCMIVLYLLLAIWVKSRRREIGILRSAGIRNKRIVLQLLLECAMVASAALVCSAFLAGPATDWMGKAAEGWLAPPQAEERYKMERDVMQQWQAVPAGEIKADLSYPVGPGNILAVGLLSAGMIIASVGMTSMAILRRSPKEILDE